MEGNLTTGNLSRTMLKFAIPYLIASFLQTFYGMADLFITGQFNSAAAVTAVSVGSQVMHMVTVMIVGLAMGTTVSISRAIGAGDRKKASAFIGNSVSVFAVLAAAATVLLLLVIPGILSILNVPAESIESTRAYLRICFAGIPFIIAYNVISSIFRGLGDTKRPMIFVAIAGVINVGLDYILVGPMGMGAAGAAAATVSSQAFSVVLALLSFRKMNTGIHVARSDFRFARPVAGQILNIGIPIAFQEGLIQISFLIITMIANSRGLAVATAVGIVEKIISFLFLVPSAMLSTVSAITAQCIGAGAEERGRKALRTGILVCIGFGAFVIILCQFIAPQFVGLFVTNEPEVVEFGGQYLRSYSIDCMLAGIHFCFSGYFSAYGKSLYSFLHNVISIAVVRIPGTYLASVLFPATLFPMGLAAPAGSLLSALICLYLYRRMRKQLRS